MNCTVDFYSFTFLSLQIFDEYLWCFCLFLESNFSCICGLILRCFGGGGGCSIMHIYIYICFYSCDFYEFFLSEIWKLVSFFFFPNRIMITHWLFIKLVEFWFLMVTNFVVNDEILSGLDLIKVKRASFFNFKKIVVC